MTARHLLIVRRWSPDAGLGGVTVHKNLIIAEPFDEDSRVRPWLSEPLVTRVMVIEVDGNAMRVLFDRSYPERIDVDAVMRALRDDEREPYLADERRRMARLDWIPADTWLWGMLCETRKASAPAGTTDPAQPVASAPAADTIRSVPDVVLFRLPEFTERDVE